MYTYVTHQLDNHPHNFNANSDGEAIEYLKKLYGGSLAGVIILVTDEPDQLGNVRTVWIERSHRVTDNIVNMTKQDIHQAVKAVLKSFAPDLVDPKLVVTLALQRVNISLDHYEWGVFEAKQFIKEHCYVRVQLHPIE